MMDNDVKRFMAMVRKESDRDEDFVMDRVKKTALFKLIESKYENIDEICQTAMRKSSWYERMKEILIEERKRIVTCMTMNTTAEEQAKNLIYRASTMTRLDSDKHHAFEKFMWRYGSDEAINVALDIVKSYPADGTLYGKFTSDLYERK